MNNDSGSLTLGPSSAYYLDGGVLTVGGDEVLSDGSNGQPPTYFRQWDGTTNTVGGTLQLGTNGGGNVNYWLHLATLTTGDMSINNGQFTQSGGSVAITGHDIKRRHL